VPEKATYFNATFLTLRDILIFGLLTAMSVWYVRSSVRLDVGQIPEWGAGWARGMRETMRAGWRGERREIHATHSMQGKLAVFLAIVFGFGWSVLAWDLSMGLSLHFQSALYSWWFFMGGWLCALTSFTLLALAWRRHLRTDLITEGTSTISGSCASPSPPSGAISPSASSSSSGTGTWVRRRTGRASA